MAIELEYHNVVVRVEMIREKLGEKAFEDQFAGLTETEWNDGLLFREGCMDQWVLSDILDDWEERGFELLEVNEGQKHWKDVCLVNSGYGPSYPCEWIDYDPDRNIAWLKGHEPGTVVGPVGR